MLRSNNNRETDVLSRGVASDEEGKAPPAVPGKMVKQKSRY